MTVFSDFITIIIILILLLSYNIKIIPNSHNKGEIDVNPLDIFFFTD